MLAQVADGDARRALTYLEIITDLVESEHIDCSLVSEIAQQGPRRFDKAGDLFYEQISALHKSVRGSDPDASLYWFCRMIDGGCDPVYIARRVVRMAVEDIGIADVLPTRARSSYASTAGRPTNASAAPRVSWRSPRASFTLLARQRATPSTAPTIRR